MSSTITDVLDFEYHYKTIIYSDMNRNPRFNASGVAPMIINSCGNFFRNNLNKITYISEDE